MNEHGGVDGAAKAVSDDFIITDDITGVDGPWPDARAMEWFRREMEDRIADGSIISFGFRLPAEVAGRFDPGDLSGPIRYAAEHGLIRPVGIE